MSKTLVVVESPAKAKKIAAMLGDSYVVKASYGHIRDLPTKPGEMGYEPNTFTPIYELTERAKDTVKYLKLAMKSCSRVLLATDPDREGEAIAWHIAEVLGVKQRDRIKFNEITEAAIKAAVAKPLPLDIGLVKAQEARRIIDRQVGWLISRPLSNKISERASAGRVQSPALALVVERERSIKAFIREQFFTAVATFDNLWTAVWPNEDELCKDIGKAELAAIKKSFVVTAFEDKAVSEDPPSPFRTSRLIQAASVALSFDPKKTMDVAQRLYQVHGLISYHRTDEANLSDEAYLMIAAYCGKQGLACVSEKRKWKSPEGAQEAHEAIRPTNFDCIVSPELDPDEQALYSLIHTRAVASQMPAAIYSVRTVLLKADEFTFKAEGKVLVTLGWRAIAGHAEDEEDTPTLACSIPFLSIGQTLNASSVQVKEHMTRPAKRYTKASLTNALESLGIGRPATYAAMVDGLTDREYVRVEKKFLHPEILGEKVYDGLKGSFSFIETDYTKRMEESLDLIVSGKLSYLTVVQNTHTTLLAELSKYGSELGSAVTQETGVSCPKCQKQMIRRKGPKGMFYGCSGYPKCNGTKQIS